MVSQRVRLTLRLVVAHRHTPMHGAMELLRKILVAWQPAVTVLPLPMPMDVRSQTIIQ